MTDATATRIAILATDGFDRSELAGAKRRFDGAGAAVRIVAPRHGSIRGRDGASWMPVDTPLVDARVEDFDALVLSGGRIDPAGLRGEAATLAFLRDFDETGKPLAAIGHAPALLLDAGRVGGRELTSAPALRADLTAAGAIWRDAVILRDRHLLTTRDTSALDALRDGLLSMLHGDARQSWVA